MAWTAPKEWDVGDLLTAVDMNTYVSDNTAALKNPPTASYVTDESSNFQTTSNSFVDVNAVFNLTLTTSGGDLLICFSGTILTGASVVVALDVELDGTRIGGNDGIIANGINSNAPWSFVRLKTGVSAASHTLKLQWKTSGSTATMYAGAGSSNYDLHPQFWVREVS
jgi:hypothetical protein